MKTFFGRWPERCMSGSAEDLFTADAASPWHARHGVSAAGAGMLHYHDREFGMDGVKIYPGGYLATQQACVLTTVVGSCISVCLWDAGIAAGGMNHFMLPDADLQPRQTHGLYGLAAMELLINALMKLGATRNSLRAKVFGGAQLMQGPGVHNIGQRNAAFIEDYLRTEGIPVLAQDVLGRQPRRLAFFPREGRVLLKRLGDMAVTERELLRQRDSALSLARRNAGGSFELFEPDR